MNEYPERTLSVVGHLHIPAVIETLSAKRIAPPGVNLRDDARLVDGPLQLGVLTQILFRDSSGVETMACPEHVKSNIKDSGLGENDELLVVTYIEDELSEEDYEAAKLYHEKMFPLMYNIADSRVGGTTLEEKKSAFISSLHTEPKAASIVLRIMGKDPEGPFQPGDVEQFLAW